MIIFIEWLVCQRHEDILKKNFFFSSRVLIFLSGGVCSLLI